MDYKKKLMQIIEDNPTFASVLEREFPDIVDIKPYVWANNLFMRGSMDKGLYQVKYHVGNNAFSVLNLINGNVWSHVVKATNVNTNPHEAEAFLSKSDFARLVGKAGIGSEKIKLVSNSALRVMHHNIFNPGF
jgi:hypothetical protein